MELSGRKEAYPLNSRRIGFEQWCLLAQALDISVTATGPDLQAMVKGKLRELKYDPADVQLVIKELSSGLQKLELHDESGAFLEVVKPDKHRVLTPTGSLASSRESMVDELIDTELSVDTGFKESLESVNTELHVLKHCLEKQRLALLESKSLLARSEERAAELALQNQQLTESLTESEARTAQLAQSNQQLTGSLAVTDEEMTKLVLQCEQLKQHSSASEVESLKGELQKAKSRVKELWGDMCEQICEFDFAMWEKDCELKSLRKQLEAKSEASAAEKTVPVGHSSGASHDTWSLPSSTVDLNRVALSQPHQPTTGLPQYGTVPVSGIFAASSWRLGQSSTQSARESGSSHQVPPSIVLPSV